MRAAFRCLLTLCFASFALASCTHGGERPGDILLITIDTLRPDHMTVYGYGRPTTPQIGRWLASGRVFDRAYATSSFTTASIVSILSGRLPQGHGVRLFDQLIDDDCTLVTELLPPAYQTAAFVSNGVLSDRAIGLARRFDHFDDRMVRGDQSRRLERTASETTDAVVEWLRAARDSDRPLFLWVHYMDPHAPYAPPGDWPRRFDRGSEGVNAPQPLLVDDGEPPVSDYLERFDAYDAEIAYTDEEVGRLLEAYAEQTDWDRALVVVTADHGETLTERALWFQHADQVTEEQVRVPLLLRGPGVQAERVSTPVSAIDLLPTMLAFAGVDPPTDLDGFDLSRPRDGTVDATVYVESMHRFDQTQLRAAIRGDAKWVVDVRPGTPIGFVGRHYYDLSQDPHERHPQTWTDRDETGHGLLDLIERDPDPAGNPAHYKKGTLVAEQLDALRQLGYMD